MPDNNNQYDNEARFVIFPNSKKEEGSKQPDYTGEITLNGVKMRLSGWRNTSKSGITYLSGKVSEFQDNSNTPVATTGYVSQSPSTGGYSPPTLAQGGFPPQQDTIPF